MKKLMILLVMLLPSSVVFSQPVIRITNGEWEPYLSEYSYEYGLASHIVSAAFELEGIHVEWGFFPWKRAYEEARSGKDWDASAVWWPSDKTKEGFLISTPVVNTSFVFFHLKSKKFHWQSFEHLKGLNIGFTRGYDYGKEFMTAVKEQELFIDVSVSDEINFRKLLHGRLDIFPNDPDVGYAQIRNTFEPSRAKQFTHHSQKFEKSTLSLIISKKSEKSSYFLKKFNSGLKKLTESGRLNLMLKDIDLGKYDKQKDKWFE